MEIHFLIICRSPNDASTGDKSQNITDSMGFFQHFSNMFFIEESPAFWRQSIDICKKRIVYEISCLN